MGGRGRDSRTYVLVHDGMDEHPKIEPLSDAAFRAFHRCLYHCSRQLTDGRLTDAAWRNRAKTPRVRRELVDAGLVHPPGHDCPHEDCETPPPGHVQLHDYLDWQRSAAEVAELREKRSESGRKGGQARAKRQANAKQPPEQTAIEDVAESESDSLRSEIRPVADPDNGFDAFYEAYPRHEARRKAEQAWKAALKRADAKTIMAGLQRFRWSPDRKFIPLPASWLNGDRWADGSVDGSAGGSGPSMSREQVDDVLGPDSWQLPAPPFDPEDDPQRFREWARNTTDAHRAERETRARAQLERASA